MSLRKAGASYKGLCPFHSEKSPSFTVNRDKGFFHCFGCQVGGDVFKFVELQEKLGFQDTVKHVAQKFGIPMPELEPGDGAGRQRGRARGAAEDARGGGGLVRRAAGLAGRRARPRLPAAGARPDRGDRSPPSSSAGRRRPATACASAWLQQGFAEGLIRQSGLVSVRDDGAVVDRFRNRLMVPIARDAGSIVAFGGRALATDQVPKYLNSPETPIYTKSRTLYGLNLTKGELRKTRFAIVVEGYFDFAQLYQAGGLPVVATCGTALTPQQAQMLRRFVPKVIINFDPDTAGQNAAERSSELLVEANFDVNVVRLPGGDDPDAFVQKHGRDAYLAELKRSQPYLEFLLDRSAAAHNLTRDDGRREFLQADARGGGAHPRPGHPRPVRRPAGPQGPGHRRGGPRRDPQGRGRPQDHPAGAADARRPPTSPIPSAGCCGQSCTSPKPPPRPSDPCNLLIWKGLPPRTCC